MPPAIATSSTSMAGEWRDWSPFARPRPAVTLALIGGQRLLREATASLLTAQDGLHVLGAFESATDFLSAAWECPPTVLLLDCDGEEHGGCQHALCALGSARGKPRIMMLCQEICEQVVRSAIEHRVSGVLLKSYSADDIRAAIAYTATGRTVMPSGWQRVVASHAGSRLGLSPRHRQILALIADGRRTEEIAMDLELSPNTIKFYIRALYARLGVHNRVEAANLYAQMTSGGI